MAKEQVLTIKTIATIIGIVVVLAGAVAAYIITSDKVEQLEPDVKLNTEFRIGAEKDIKHIYDGIEDIKAIQTVILEKMP